MDGKEAQNQTTYTNIFLGTVEWQNLTVASLKNRLVYGSFIGEGMLMVLGNALLITIIILNKPLRRKEMYIMAGLAMGDLLYGMGFFFSGIRRLSLALEGKHLWNVTPWSCMKAIQTPFFIAGSQAAAFMLVMLSLDRFLAVRYFAFYMGLTSKYAKSILLSVYLYCILTVPTATLLSAFAADPNPTVPAICISTHVGPSWFASYQPIIQMSCGILSVLIYILTWYFYKRQMETMPQRVQNQQFHSQRKLTRTVGITVLFTFFCYVLPHGMIFFFNTFQASKHLAGLMSPYGWVLSNVNSITNIFIVGIHNKDVRGVLQAWIKCTKPEFSGGHISQGKSHGSNNATPNPRNRFRRRSNMVTPKTPSKMVSSIDVVPRVHYDNGQGNSKPNHGGHPIQAQISETHGSVADLPAHMPKGHSYVENVQHPSVSSDRLNLIESRY